MNVVGKTLTLNFGKGVRHSIQGLDIRALLPERATTEEWETGEMKTFTALVALTLATAVAGTASAASKKHVHHHVTHVAHASGTASTTDWPGNPYMDLKESQVQRFWHDAFDPYDATAK